MEPENGITAGFLAAREWRQRDRIGPRCRDLDLVGFAALAGVVMGWLPEGWWPPLAITSATVSLMGLLLFALAILTFSTPGALAVDVALLVAVLLANWEPGELAIWRSDRSMTGW